MTTVKRISLVSVSLVNPDAIFAPTSPDCLLSVIEPSKRVLLLEQIIAAGQMYQEKYKEHADKRDWFVEVYFTQERPDGSSGLVIRISVPNMSLVAEKHKAYPSEFDSLYILRCIETINRYLTEKQIAGFPVVLHGTANHVVNVQPAFVDALLLAIEAYKTLLTSDAHMNAVQAIHSEGVLEKAFVEHVQKSGFFDLERAIDTATEQANAGSSLLC